jgi:hypothetical protein
LPAEQLQPLSRQLLQGSIELVAVAPHPSEGQAWWKGDGTPASEGPFLPEREGGNMTPQPDLLAREFVLRSRNLPAGASSVMWLFTPEASFTGAYGSPLSQAGEFMEEHHLVAASLPASARSVSIRAGIAIGAWMPIVTGTPGVSSGANLHWHVSFAEPMETRDGEVVIHVSIVRSRRDWEQRVVAFNRAGEKVIPSRTTSRTTQITAHFAGMRLSEIAEVRFEVRPFEWVEIPNIALYPAKP